MRDSVPSTSYSSVCNVLRQWSISLIPTYRVYRFYNTVEPPYSGHPWDRKVSLIESCPHFRGQNVHNTNVIQWNLSIPDTLGQESVPNREVSSFQGSKCTRLGQHKLS